MSKSPAARFSLSPRIETRKAGYGRNDGQIKDPLRVVFFGDSICVGQGVSIHAGWVTRIAQRCDQIASSLAREVVVSNVSVNGRITRQALEGMPYEVQSQGVDILIIQFGLNDCNYWLIDGSVPRVSSAAFAANLKEIITRGRVFGAVDLFVNTNHPTLRDQECFPNTSITFEQSNRHYNRIIRDVANEMSDFVMLNDIEAVFDHTTRGKRENLEAFLLDDGIHLSRKGHDLYFGEISKKISQCVEGCDTEGGRR